MNSQAKMEESKSIQFSDRSNITQTPTKQTLYNADLNLWLETAIVQLQTGDLQNLYIDNLLKL